MHGRRRDPGDLQHLRQEGGPLRGEAEHAAGTAPAEPLAAHPEDLPAEDRELPVVLLADRGLLLPVLLVLPDDGRELRLDLDLHPLRQQGRDRRPVAADRILRLPLAPRPGDPAPYFRQARRQVRVLT